MKKILLPICILLIQMQILFAAPVHKNTAETLALNYYLFTLNETQSKHVAISSVYTDLDPITGQIYFYAVNFSDTGFVLVSGDNTIAPVLGYSHSSFFTGSNYPVQLVGLLNEYRSLIAHASTNETELSNLVAPLWEDLINGSILENKGNRSITGPMVPCLWDQSSFYNGLCPEDPAGPNGRVYAGCVATAMSMAMYHYRYPITGQNSHGYVSDYGYLFVDFAQSTYDWNGMPTKLTSPNYPVAKLQYDAGVAVDMMYSPNGSGAYMDDAANAMIDYFGYSSSVALAYRDDYSLNDWVSLLQDELDLGHPLIYAGYDSNGPGHAFLCDGYDSDDLFHYNWGWSGAYNGFYVMDYLTPGGYNFSNWQMAVINIYPEDVNYPYGCQSSNTITSISGTLTDGSGPHTYENNTMCTWLISPIVPCESISIQVHRLNTESINDILYIYDGADSGAPLLASLSGDSVPTVALTSTGPQVYIVFQSNGSLQDEGFYLEYSGKKTTFCTNLQTLTEAEGTIEDGSGSNQYHANSLCRWWIKPDNAGAIVLDFEEFNIEEDGDFLVLMDPSTYPSSEIVRFTGDDLPSSYTHWGSSLILKFVSNDFVELDGWKVNYSIYPTSVNEVNTDLIQVFPNPFGSTLNIHSTGENAHVRIVNILGEIVFEQTYSYSAPIVIPTEHFSNGMYFIHVSSEQNHSVIKATKVE